MNKRIKKIVVNSLTFSRILGTVLMPFLYVYLDSFIFLIVIGILLLTDFFDGLLAKIWGVRTLFGSLLDMLADKLLALSILVILGFIYKMMFIPLIIEVLITLVNIRSAFIGGVTKSSEIGRIKMWIVGIAIFLLFLINFSDELNNIINSSIFSLLIVYSNQIKTILISASIFTEFIVLCDYISLMVKRVKKHNKKNDLSFNLINKNGKYIKGILFDEDYYLKTIDKPLSEKIMP